MINFSTTLQMAIVRYYSWKLGLVDGKRQGEAALLCLGLLSRTRLLSVFLILTVFTELAYYLLNGVTCKCIYIIYI